MTIIYGDAFDILPILPRKSVNLCFTSPSPPNTYNNDWIGGIQKDYVSSLVGLFDLVKDVLTDDGCLFVQLGDYHDESGSMTLTPEKFVMEMYNHDWKIRSKLVWYRTEKFKVVDRNRFVRNWEYLYFFTQSLSHYFLPTDDITSVIPAPYIEPRNEYESGFPTELIKKTIIHCCPKGGTVLDPLAGGGSVGVVAKKMKRKFILIDIDEDNYTSMMTRFRYI